MAAVITPYSGSGHRSKASEVSSSVSFSHEDDTPHAHAVAHDPHHIRV